MWLLHTHPVNVKLFSVVDNAGEGVRTTFATYKEVEVYDIEYCACAELRRHVSSQDGSTKAGHFEVITRLGQSGIKYH